MRKRDGYWQVELNPDIAPPLERVVLKALAHEAKHRFQTAAEFREALTPGGRVAITGRGGTGKSELAKAYARAHRDEYEHRFWVNAETNETMHPGLFAVATGSK